MIEIICNFLNLVRVEACMELGACRSLLHVSSKKTLQRGEDMWLKLLQAWSSTSELANLCASGSICSYASVEFIALHTVCMNSCNLCTRKSDSMQLSSLFGIFNFTMHFSLSTFSLAPYVHAATSQIFKKRGQCPRFLISVGGHSPPLPLLLWCHCNNTFILYVCECACLCSSPLLRKASKKDKKFTKSVLMLNIACERYLILQNIRHWGTSCGHRNSSVLKWNSWLTAFDVINWDCIRLMVRGYSPLNKHWSACNIRDLGNRTS